MVVHYCYLRSKALQYECVVILSWYLVKTACW
ncbi:Uncharacterised protein [Vibrio cholerae]|nr:Uncharacterised protein [Vibrio cholerae]